MTDTEKRKNRPSKIDERIRSSHFEIITKPGKITDAIFQHSVLCQTFLPYRNPGTERIWQHRQGKVSLAVQANDAINPETDKFEFVGLPYGTKARILQLQFWNLFFIVATD